MKYVLALVCLLSGCYLSHETSGRTDASVRDGAIDVAVDAAVDGAIPGCLEPIAVDETGFTPSIVVAGQPDVRLQGTDFVIGWVDDCRQHIYWIENRGRLVVAGAVVDGGRLVAGPFDVIGEVPVEIRPDSVVARRLGNQMAVYWITREPRRLMRRFVSLDGRQVGEPVELASGVGNRLPLTAVDDRDGHAIMFQIADVPHMVWANQTDTQGPTALARQPVDWVYAMVAANDESQHLVHADRNPRGDDRLLRWETHWRDGSIGPEQEVLRRDNVILSFFGSPLLHVDGTLFAGISHLRDGSFVYAIRDASIEAFPLEAGRPLLAYADGRVLALSASTMSSRLMLTTLAQRPGARS